MGVGGGFAIVPALVLLAKLPMKQAIGTSLLIIIANSITGFMGYLGHVDLNWHLIISFIFAASLGTIPGAYLARYVPAHIPPFEVSHQELRRHTFSGDEMEGMV